MVKKGEKQGSAWGFAGEIIKDQLKSGVVGHIKDQVDSRMQEWRAKMKILAWEVALVFIGVVFLLIGVSEFLQRFLTKEVVFLVMGLVLILAGVLYGNRAKNIRFNS